MQPTVSVVMPYYKNERTLTSCLHSFAAAQSLSALEILIVDDGGPRRAAEVCRSATGPWPVRFFQTPHVGQSAATNVGIRAARGDIVMLSCADIIAAPQLLAEHVKAHMQAPKRAVLGFIPYAPSVKMTPFMQFLRSSGVQFDFDGIDDCDHVDGLWLYAPNVSVRAEDLRQVGGFDAALTYGYQDTDLGLRLQQSGVQLVYRAAAVGYHDHPNELAHFIGRQELMGEASLLILARHPGRGFEEKFIAGAEYALPRLQLLEPLFAEATRIEARIAARPALLRPLRPKLFALYRLVCLLAVYRGTLRHRHAYPKSLAHRLQTLLAQQPDASFQAASPKPSAPAPSGV